jgi:hypothetical protein
MANITFDNKTDDAGLPITDERRRWTAANANEVKTVVNSKQDQNEFNASSFAGNIGAINELSHIITVENANIQGGIPVNYTVPNDLVNTGSIVQAWIVSASGGLLVLTSSRCDDGQITIGLLNHDEGEVQSFTFCFVVWKV